MKNIPKSTLIIISRIKSITIALLYTVTNSVTQTVDKIAVRIAKAMKTIITKYTISIMIKMVQYISNKTNKQIVPLMIIAMVMDSNTMRKHDMETTNLSDNTEDNNPPGEKNYGDQISIAT